MKIIFKAFLYIAVVLLALGSGIYLGGIPKGESPLPKIITREPERTLDKYSIENLSKTQVEAEKIEIGEILKDEEDFSSYLFSINFDPTLSRKEKRKMTGLINIPKKEGSFPVVLMLRGYADQKTYTTGVGTRRAAEEFVKSGFITVAPDFLGYGGSDSEAANIFETRFQSYTTALSTLSSIKSIEKWDQKNIFIWGHSNGGQVALTLLEITEGAYPTVLWAPVSKPFPYSVLYYTDESEDRGKFLRSETAKFEELYNADLYSPDRYFEKIKAPIELHQGGADDAVPIVWSNALNKILSDLKVDISYFKYPGADHNLNPSWDTVVLRNIAFFKKHQVDK